MSMIKAYAGGVRATFANKRLWLLLYAVQLGLALLLIAPLKTAVQSLLGQSLLGQDLLEGRTGLVLVEFVIHQAQAVAMVAPLLVWGGIAFLFLTLFLNGGILGLFVKDQRFVPATFFGDAGAYFWRFVRLFLTSILYLLVAVLVYVLLNKGLMAFKGDSEPLAFLLRLIGLGVLGLLGLVVQMVFDYAKIMTVAEDRRGMFKTALKAWGFVFRHLCGTFGLYLLVGLTGLVLFIFFTQVMKVIPATTGFLIFILFVWQQLHSFVRAGLKLLHLGSASRLYGTLSA